MDWHLRSNWCHCDCHCDDFIVEVSKMKKRVTSIVLVLILVIGMTIPVMADPMPFILDESDVLTDEDTVEFQSYAENLEQNYGVQIIYICTDLLNGLDNETYTEQISAIYSEDCIILLDNQETGTIYMQGFGKAIELLDDETCHVLLSAYNKNSTYSGGLQAYMESVEECLINADLGTAKEPMVITEDKIPSAIFDESLLPRLNDEADILTAQEEAKILGILDEISERQMFDVVIAVVNDFEQNNVKDAAYDYYDYNGFGYGENNDGVCLYLSMEERDLNIGGTGFGIVAFSDFGREQILEQIKPELSKDDYYAAFLEFAQICDDYVSEANNGTPYDVDHKPFKDKFNSFYIFWGVLFVGIIVAFILVKIEERKLKSVHYARDAQDYMRKGSMHLVNRMDCYVYSNTVSEYDPKNDDDGGSKVDSGSSGVSHSSTSSKF